MAENLVREKRETRKLTQHALAKLVGTSQQQIQRIESGVQAVRLEMAVAIAKALEVTLVEIFPKLPRAEGRRRSKKPKEQPKWASKEFLEAGIDPDPRHWTLKLGLRNGEHFLYRVSSEEKERVAEIVWHRHFNFVVFDTKAKRIAIRHEEINFCQFLFDIGGVAEKDESEDSFNLEVHFISGEPITFGVEPDQVERSKDEGGRSAQLQNIFFELESDIGEDDIIWFDDEDAERVYIRRKQLLRIELPLLCCEPALWGNSLENIEEDYEDPSNRNSDHGKEDSEP